MGKGGRAGEWRRGGRENRDWYVKNKQTNKINDKKVAADLALPS